MVTVLLALVLFTLRGGWGPGSGEGEAVIDENRPVVFQAERFRFDLVPERSGVDTVIASVRDRVREQARSLDLSKTEIDRLTSALDERLGILLRPRFEDWYEVATRWRDVHGAALPQGADPASEKHEDFLRKWNHAAKILAGAPIASEGVRAREVSPDDERPRAPTTRGLFTGGRGDSAIDYPEPPAGDPSLRMIEVLVPMQYNLPLKAGERIPTTASIRLYKTAGQPRWRPTDLALYFGEASMGKGLMVPIY